MDDRGKGMIRRSVIAAGLIAAAQGAAAQWQFEATPYLFASGIEGDVKVGRLPTGGVETSFSDLTKMLDYGFMGALEGRKGEVGFLADAVFMKVGTSAGTPGLAFGEAQGDMTQQVYSLAGLYRVGVFDLVGGIRYMRIKADLIVTSGIVGGRRANATKNFTDGIVGARFQVPIADRWTLVGYGDVGGGGSDLSYQLVGGVNYASSKDVTWKGGYRYMAVDYRKDAFVYDVAYAGPYLGVGFRF